MAATEPMTLNVVATAIGLCSLATDQFAVTVGWLYVLAVGIAGGELLRIERGKPGFDTLKGMRVEQAISWLAGAEALPGQTILARNRPVRRRYEPMKRWFKIVILALGLFLAWLTIGVMTYEYIPSTSMDSPTR